MSVIRFEDQEVTFHEDIDMLDCSYDIQEDNLIATKTLKQTITSNMFNYDDGISVYLKFEDNAEYANLMFALYQANEEKKIISIPVHTSLFLKRIDKAHFHLITEDNLNHEQNFVAITIKDETDIVTTKYNFTKIVEYKILDNMYVLINGYEALNNGYIYTMAIYNLAGMAIKVMLDKRVKEIGGYEFVIQQLPKSKRKLLAINNCGPKSKVIGKFPLPEGLTTEEINMLLVNQEKITKSKSESKPKKKPKVEDKPKEETEEKETVDDKPIENEPEVANEENKKSKNAKNKKVKADKKSKKKDSKGEDTNESIISDNENQSQSVENNVTGGGSESLNDSNIDNKNTSETETTQSVNKDNN